MYVNIFLVIIAINMFSVCGQNASISHSAPRIVGGYDCPLRDYLFTVAILKKNLCGGSLITAKWVVTAGHCISHDDIISGDTELRIGFQKKSFVQERIAVYGIRHPKFDYAALIASNPELRYDIGLILAGNPFLLNSKIKLSKLPSPGFTKNCIAVSQIGTVAGIGEEYPRSLKTKILKCVDLPIVDHDVCSQSWPTSIIDDSIICTMTEEGGKDSCKGDSGGPLVCGTNQGPKVLIGLVSSRQGCGRPYRASTFTSIEFFIDWIYGITNSKIPRRSYRHGNNSHNNGNRVSTKIIFSENILIVTAILFLLLTV